MAKKKTESKLVKVILAITIPLRKLFAWLEKLGEGQYQKELEAQRKAYQDEPAPTDEKRVVRAFLRACRHEAKIKDAKAQARKCLLQVWAQMGKTNLFGVVVSTPASYEVDVEKAMGIVPAEHHSMFLRPKFEADLKALLQLFADGVVPQDKLLECLTVSVTPTVTPPDSLQIELPTSNANAA